MDTNKLRVGNYYKAGIEFKGSIEAKIDMNEERLFWLTRGNLALIINCDLEAFVNPIPLTEDWVLGYATYVDKVGGGYELYELQGTNYNIKYCNDVYTLCEHNHKIRDMKFVHELQDLILILTGKEAEMRSNQALYYVRNEKYER